MDTRQRIAFHAALVLGFLLGLAPASAGADAVYALNHITRKDGLPQSSVRAIAVDSRGFVWLGTERSVARYDGYRFREPQSPLNAGVAVKLFVDSRDRVWTRWYGKPTTLYDPADESWKVIETTAVSANAPDYIGEMLELANGVIFYSTNNRLYRFDETTHEMRVVADITPEPALSYQLQYAQRIAFFDGDVWVAGHGELLRVPTDIALSAARMPFASNGIVRLWAHDNSLWMCHEHGVSRLRSGTDHWELIQRAPFPALTSCLVDADDAIWMGFASDGALRVHQDLRWHFPPANNASALDRTRLAGRYVINIQQDRRGNVWVITPGVAHRWLGDGIGAFERFEFSPDSQTDNPGGVATNLFVEDPHGVLWLGSEDHGLARLSAFARKVRWFVPPSAVNTHVRAPAIDSQGNVWMGTNQDGVYRWNSLTANWTHFAANVNAASSLPTSEVRALKVSRQGAIWAGSQKNGVVSRFDPARGDWRRFDLGSPGAVFNVLELANGSLLLGRESGVTELDPRTRRARQYYTPNQSPVRATFLSRTGTVYVGTHQSGVLEWVPERGFSRAWDTTLSDRNVFALYEDRAGALWVGTWGGGLNRLDPASTKIQFVTTADGLPDNTIYGILPGKHDDLWVSTNNGLARIEECIGKEWPCRPKITILDVNTGLPFAEFDAEAHAVAPNGDLLFGGYQGLIQFDPDRLERNQRPPQLQVSALFLNDRELPAAATRANSAPLALPHDFGSLRIQFSALDFNESTRNRYRYRLSSREWLSLGATPELLLSDLGAGEHRLELMGTNSDGVWSTKPLTLLLRVAAPWYSSATAWVAYAIGALLALGLVIQWRERRLHANAALLEATVATRTAELATTTRARDEFYANVSHEVRTPLTLLVATAEQLKDTRDASRQAVLADDLIRHSDSLRRYVESLITVSHLQSAPNVAWMREDIAIFLRNLLTDFERIAGRTKLTLQVQGEDLFVRSYPNALDTIFDNLIVNALRHTPDGGEIVVSIEGKVQTVDITILDSGRGIDPKVLTTIFDRGVRGESTARASSGYGIGLNLVKQTVSALGGSITAQNATERGACFAVSLLRAHSDLPVAKYARSPLPADRAPDSAAAPSRLPASRSRGNILIIEDHDELRAHLADLLAPIYRVRAACTLKQGLADARRYLPDVVICDVMLPDGQGFDVVTAIKSDALTDHISVILLTALADESSRLRGLETQADLYITKPFSQRMLTLQVATLINQRRRLRRAAAQEAWAAQASAQKIPPKAAGFEAQLLAVMEALYTNSECDVDVLAKRLALSRKQLERKTRYCFKCSPKLLLNRFRLDKAHALLQNGVRVGDAAEQCGFSNPSHFGVLFKRQFGHPPAATPAVESPSTR